MKAGRDGAAGRTPGACGSSLGLGSSLGSSEDLPLTELSMLCSPLQFRLTMSYLSQMTEEQTLVMYSGHPLGLFPSSPGAPRLVITNGMVRPGQPGTAPWGWQGEQVARRPLAIVSENLCCAQLWVSVPLFQVIPNYSSRTEYEKLFAMGVTM